MPRIEVRFSLAGVLGVHVRGVLPAGPGSVVIWGRDPLRACLFPMYSLGDLRDSRLDAELVGLLLALTRAYGGPLHPLRTTLRVIQLLFIHFDNKANPLV